jgi:DNA/RNA-binding domain of Phe-tRNA-synthetase-like protein
MLRITASHRWQTGFPGGHVGLLEMSGIENARRPTPLDAAKAGIEQDLRRRYAGFTRAGFLQLETMQAYDRYYRHFDKTYHVQLQLESIVLKGKSLPNVSPLVEANFVVELDTLVLTAGHDAATLRGDVRIDATDGGEPFTQMNGTSRTLRAGDMCMADEGGVVCTILYGQDARTAITESTTHVLYVSYAPAGVPAQLVQAHLERLRDCVRLVSPEADVQQLNILAGEAQVPGG